MAAASSSGVPPKKPKAKKAQGKQPFKVPNELPKQYRPPAPKEDEELARRVPPHTIRPAPVPQKLRQAANAAGLTFKPELPDAFAHAAWKSGRPQADKMMRSTAENLVKKGVRFGSGDFDPEHDVAQDDGEKELVTKPFTDIQLRQAFNVFDLDGNEFIDAAELRHIFAQIGEMPTDNEISAMIMLCDPRGDGTVNFDDFLNVFSTPAESLRNCNVKGLKHLLPRKKVDFDVRDPLGIVMEERSRVKDRWLVVVEVRKGSQAQDAGVKNGWKVVTLEGEPIYTEKDFDAKIKKLEKAAAPDDGEGAALESLGGAKSKAKAKAASKEQKQKIKYDYAIVFEVLPGVDDTSSEEEVVPEEEEEEDDEDEDAEEDD